MYVLVSYFKIILNSAKVMTTAVSRNQRSHKRAEWNKRPTRRAPFLTVVTDQYGPAHVLQTIRWYRIELTERVTRFKGHRELYFTFWCSLKKHFSILLHIRKHVSYFFFFFIRYSNADLREFLSYRCSFVNMCLTHFYDPYIYFNYQYKHWNLYY